jgi:D-xylose transport system permease protein
MGSKTQLAESKIEKVVSMNAVSAAPKASAKGAVSDLTDQIRANIQTYAIIVALMLIWGFFFAMTDGRYLKAQNFSNLFRQMTTTAFLSVGMVLVIVTGNIDLSVGKAAGFVSVVVAKFQDDIWTQILPEQVLLTTIISVVIGLGVGTLIGMLQGYVISYMRVPSFIVTLGGMWIFNGGILLVTEGKTIAADQPEFSVISQGYLSDRVGWIIAAGVVALLIYTMANNRQKKRRYGFELAPLYLDLLKTALFAGLVILYVYVVNKYNGVQVPVLLLATAAIAVSYLSSNTRFGRYAYAIGGNREAARLSGINIRQNVFRIFILMGFLCGVGGVALASYVGYGTIAAGDGYELDAIAACILGGTSTLGGEGTVFGAMVGSLIMASLTNGLQIMNVEAAWQYLVKGVVLVLAVYTDVYLRKNR